MASSYPSGLDELTNGVPSDGIAASTPTGSGTYPHDDHHRLVGEAIEAMQAEMQGGYASYTPTITASTTAPTMGTGATATGRYKRLGHRVVGDAVIVFGSSGVVAGSGYYGLSLPVEPANRVQPIGIGYLFDYDDNTRFVVASASVSPALWASSLSRAIIVNTNEPSEGFATGDNPVGAATPWTWAEQDQIVLSFSYEAAASA